MGVTGVAPYADAFGEVTVDAGRISELTITLVLMVEPVEPTPPGAATPVVEETTVPGETDEGQPGAIVEDPEVATTGNPAPAMSDGDDSQNLDVSVQALPNTRIGQHASGATLAGPTNLASLLLLLLGGAVVIVAGGVAWRRRGHA